MAACVLLADTWYLHIVVALTTFFGGLLIILPCRLIWYCLFSVDDDKAEHTRDSSWWTSCSRVRAWAMGLTEPRSGTGKALVVFVFLCNMASIIIYLIDASHFTESDCGPVRTESMQIAYAALCGVFTVHYILRFVAAPDKLSVWIDIYSIVDHMTVAPFFYAIYSDENWLTLKFLRLLYLLQIAEVLQMTHILKSSSTIRVTQIVTIFISVWFTAAGLAQLIEDTAPLAPGYDSRSYLGYWETVYWLLVTMSTVGFGEISPQTNVGRAFIVVYIIGTFAMFSAVVPELVRHVGRGAKYKKPYKRIYGKRHVIVCGNITYDTMTRFIRDFVHQDADNRNIDIVFIDNNKPNLEMEAFFKRHYSNITFIQGSVMDITTLRNAKLRDAAACLILANRHATNPDEEDGANIMRAAALKNYDARVRIIIQLLQSHNKTYLLHIPNWNWDKTHGDDVLCISELKLGLMAQNCLAKGFCCLMANLFTMRSYKSNKSGTWEDDYRCGAGNEIYVQTFSSAFVGLSFGQAAATCFTEFGVTLVAIQSDTPKSRGRLRVNPQRHATINLGMRGFFIAQGPEQVRGVRTYKPSVGGMADANANDVRDSPSLRMNSTGPKFPTDDRADAEHQEYLENIGSRLASYRHRKPSLDVGSRRMSSKDGPPEIFDYTGMFHWCATRSLEDAIVDYKKARELQLSGHIVVCLLSDSNSPLVGLANFVMPLRASNFAEPQLKDILILGNPEYIQKEWDALANFPRIYIFNGSASHRPDLRTAEVEKCSMCVILSAKRHILVDTTLLDKEAILTNLNVQGMFGKDTEQKIRSLGIVNTEEELIEENCKATDIPITTELEIEHNVAFLDQDDDDDPDTPLYMTHPYVSGSALATTCLDSLLAATFQSSYILALVRAFITGGETAELERILAEGLGIVRRHNALDQHYAKERCRVNLLPYGEGPFKDITIVLDPVPEKKSWSKKETNRSNPKNLMPTYGDLWLHALRNHNALCLGIYRLMNAQGSKVSRTNKRYVITNPPRHFKLLPSDKIYCLQPSTAEGDLTSGATTRRLGTVASVDESGENTSHL